MNFYLHNFNYRRGEKCFMSYNRVHICMEGIIILHKIYSRSLRCGSNLCEQSLHRL